MAIPPKNLSFSPEDLAGQERKAKRQDQAGAFASWLNSMTIRPDPNLPAQLQAARGERVEGLRKNRTVNMLEQAGQTELANLVKAGTLDAKSAASQMFQLAAEERQFARQKELIDYKAGMTETKVSAKEQAISRLTESGMSREVAVGIVDGRFYVDRDPVTKRVKIVDLSGRMVLTPDAKISDTISSEAEQPKKGLFSDLDLTASVGGLGFLTDIANTVVDAVSMRPYNKEALEGSEALAKLSNDTVLMLDADFAGKPTNFTRELLRERTVLPSQIGTGQGRALAKARLMRDSIKNARDGAATAINNPEGFSPEKIKSAQLNISKLNSLLIDYQSLVDSLQGAGAVDDTSSNSSGLMNLSPEDQALVLRNLPQDNQTFAQENMLPSPN
jgi:hypothetical protein